MSSPTKAPHVRFYNDDDGTEISVTKLKVVLPDSQSFVIEAQPGRDGSVVFLIPGADPEDKQFSQFIIEPGACNLFSVKVASASKRPVE